jgi:Na+/H+ antiporter NhaD/arsenite permease-like protein
MLRERGVHIPYSLYVRIGIPVTLIAVALSLLTLHLELLLYQYFVH